MKFKLTHNGNLLTLVDGTGIEIDQLNISLRERISSWKWDPRVKKGFWDGYISYFKANKYAPAGLWHYITEVAKKYNMPIEIEGLSDKFNREIKFDEFNVWALNLLKNHPKITPRDYQIEAAYKILKYQSCMAELATSAGKSLIVFMVFMYLLEHKNVDKILMIVPNVSLVLQAAEDFYDYNQGNDIDLNIQQIYSGSKIRQKSNIVIGTYQSLVKKKNEYFKQFQAVAVDETHKAKSASIKTILEKCLTPIKFGLSGTIPKKETLERLTLEAYTGPVITQVSADFLIKKGHITPVEIDVIKMNYVNEKTRKAFQQLTKTEEDRKRLLNLEQTYVVNNKPRLNFVTNTILSKSKNSLVLFYRVEYGNAIYDQLRDKVNGDRRILYIDGSTNKDVRDQYKAEMEEGTGKILVASFGTFSTGINVKNLHTVFLTESFKSDVIIRQSIGRGLRKHETKDKLLIVDFVDDFCYGSFKNYLYRHSIRRQDIYKEQNFPFKCKEVNLLKSN